jgi:uncharacterized protein YdhG (YjbR/CyaY superfamily)
VRRQFATIDEYISSASEDAQVVLEKVRQIVRHAAPAVRQRISYQIPTFTLDGRDLVYVAAWKHHVSLYPVPTADEPLERELAPFRAAKATVRFPLRKPIPYDLIGRLVAFRLKQQLEGGEGKQ